MPNATNTPFEFGNECLQQRFWRKITVNTETGCWEWTACKTNKGYSIFRLNGENTLGHRIAYAAFIGGIPHGKHIDHLCRVRHCVNPTHMEAVLPRENNARGESLSAQNARKTQCPTCGSEYTKGARSRYCRPCLTKWARDNRQRLKAQGKGVKDMMSPEAYERRKKKAREYYYTRKQNQDSRDSA